MKKISYYQPGTLPICDFSNNNISTWENPNVFTGSCNSRFAYTQTLNTQYTPGSMPDRMKEIILQASKRTKFYSKHERFINELSFLHDGWDSYDAPAPNRTAIKRAKEVLICLWNYESELALTKIMPSVEGGIYFLFVKGNKYADLECDNDGDVIAGMSDRISEPIIWEVGREKSEINNSFERMINFMREQ